MVKTVQFHCTKRGLHMALDWTDMPGPVCKYACHINLEILRVSYF